MSSDEENSEGGFWKTFDEPNTLLKAYRHWKVLVRNRNTTLGNCVIALRRDAETMSEVSQEEMAELAVVIKDLESALYAAFRYDKINYTAWMMTDNHVHFHVLPRYSSKRVFAGIEWADIDWPRPTISKQENVSSETLQAVRSEIRKNLP